MKILCSVCAFTLLVSSQLFAMDARSEMMVRYYEDKPIVEKRSSISLDSTHIKLDDTSSITLNDEGLHASKGVLILDTFSLKYNPKHSYILLTSREVDHPSEPILLARKGNDIYIVDLEKELAIGNFRLTQSNTPSYITLIEDTYGYTSLQINDAKKRDERDFMVYNGEYYTHQKEIK